MRRPPSSRRASASAAPSSPTRKRPISGSWARASTAISRPARWSTSEAFTSEQLYGIGGSIRSAAKVYGDLCNEGDRFDYLTPEHLDAILALYEDDPDRFAHRALRTVPDRIHTFSPGCIIIREVFDLCQGSRLDICKFGVREGYLAERILVTPIGVRP